MKKFLKKLLALSVIMALCVSAAPVQAADTAAAIRLTKTEGTVSVTNSGGRSLTKRDNMRLYNGYHVGSQGKSYAWLQLDSEKLSKLDESSEVEVRKSGKLLELLLNEGNLYFNVTEPLKEDESLNIRTSTMVVGIRGTCGWVKVLDQYNTMVYVLEGTVWCTITDPVSGQSKVTALSGGERAIFTVYQQPKDGEKCAILRENFTKADVDGFVLAELVGDDTMCEKIFKDSGLDLREITEAQVQERLEKDQAANAEEQRQKELLEASKDNNVSIDPVWGGQSTPSSGGSGGSSTPSDSSIVRLTMPVTDMQIQQELNKAATTQVIVSPGSASQALEIGISMSVPAGKTLTLESGIPAEVIGSLTVDGTADLGDDLTNDGTVTVNSANTLRVGGTLTNRNQFTVTATGRSITEGSFVNTGTVTLTQGARVMAHGFTLTVPVPGWQVAPEQSGGYDILEAHIPQKSVLTLNFNNGTASGTVETDDNGRLTGPLPTPTDPEGGEFQGWYTEDGSTDESKKVTQDTVFTGDAPLYAVWKRTTGDFAVTGGTAGTDYSYADNTLTISGTAPLTIAMKDGVTQTTADSIFVAGGVSASITLDGVEIDMSGTGSGSGLGDAPFSVADNSAGNVTVTLSGENTLKGGAGRAGLEKNGEDAAGTLTITGDGGLTAAGGSIATGGGGTGIGSGAGKGSANITIAGGTVTAQGGGYAADIGTSNNYDTPAGPVAILNGIVTGDIIASSFTMENGTLNGSVADVTESFTMTGGEIVCDSGNAVSVTNLADLTLTGGTITCTGSNVFYTNSNHLNLTEPIKTTVRGKYIDFVEGQGSGSEPMCFTPGGYVADGPREDGYYYLIPLVSDFVVTGGTEGTDYWILQNKTLYIRTDTPMTISMREGVTTTTTDRIRVDSGVSANLTLNGVKIDRRGPDGTCAFEVMVNDDDPYSRADVTLTLQGENALLSGNGGYCGLQFFGATAKSNTLTIKGNGTLTAQAGTFAEFGGLGIDPSAIGGVDTYDGTAIGAEITIGGTVQITALNADGTAGFIGGDRTKMVTVEGGKVNGSIEAYGFTITGGEVASDREYTLSQNTGSALSFQGGTLTNNNADGYIFLFDGEAAGFPDVSKTAFRGKNSDPFPFMIMGTGDAESFLPAGYTVEDRTATDGYFYLASTRITLSSLNLTAKAIQTALESYDMVHIENHLGSGSTVIVTLEENLTIPVGKVVSMDDNVELDVGNHQNQSDPAPALTVNGTLRTGWDVNVYGTLNVGEQGVVDVQRDLRIGASKNSVGAMTNDGTILMRTAGHLFEVTPDSSVVNRGTIDLNNPVAVTISGPVENSGMIQNVGRMTVYRKLTMTDGEITADSTDAVLFLSFGSSLELTGGTVTQKNENGCVVEFDSYADTVVLPETINTKLRGKSAALLREGGEDVTVERGYKATTEGYSDGYFYLVPVPSAAAGAFTVTGGEDGTDYSYADGVLTVHTDTPLVIANTDPGAPTTDRILVEKDKNANIILAGVNIDTSTANAAAFQIAGNSAGNVNITLAARTENTLKSGGNYAGLSKNCSGSTGSGALTIDGTNGLLTAIGGQGAGIGANSSSSNAMSDAYIAENITIKGGIIRATGGDYGPGIGSGLKCIAYNITIAGGYVTATGGRYGAGIGGGPASNGTRNINITGGTVTAAGGAEGGAGIGGGYSGNGGGTTITGGIVTATGGAGGGAGIGSGTKTDNAGGWGVNGGTASEVTVSGGSVTAAGGGGAPGIGAGIGDTRGSSRDIAISGTADVTADIFVSSGYFKMEGGEIISDKEYTVYTDAGVTLTLTGGTITNTRAVSGSDGAALSMGDTADFPATRGTVIRGKAFAMRSLPDGCENVQHDDGYYYLEPASTAEAGAFSVTGGTLDMDCKFADRVLTVMTDKSLTIANKNTGTASKDRILVSNDVSASVTLAGSEHRHRGLRRYGGPRRRP